jgi:citronellol/citronellal dehydrogenase
MTDQPSPAKLGLTDEELAAHATTFAADACKGHVVVVTGGAGGIGRAIAWLFARLGAHVAVVGRDGGKLDALVAQLADRGLEASAHVADIREPDAVNALFDTIWAAHGRVDSLVNSAGGQFPQAAIDFSIKGWNAVINTNLNGTWYMMQAAAQRWRDRQHAGSIVNIVVVTTHGLYGIAHTIAARSGVIGLSRAVAVEWAPLDIRVNCVAPGPVWTPLNPADRAAEQVAKFGQQSAMKRAAQPEEIAPAYVFLAAPSCSSFITGEILPIVGGYSG